MWWHFLHAPMPVFFSVSLNYPGVYAFNCNIIVIMGRSFCFAFAFSTIGIDHDTVCAGVVGTAIGTARVVPAVARPLAAAPAGTTSAVPDCSTNHDSADRISGQFLFYHDHSFTKSKENLRFRRLVPLFVPIGVCVTTLDDGTASDVTIGMWRHNRQRTTSATANLGFHSQSSLTM